MTPETILSLLCKLNDTIDAQSRQIEQLQEQVRQLAIEASQEYPSPDDSGE